MLRPGLLPLLLPLRPGREVFERAIDRVTRQAANANAIVDEAMAAGLDGSGRLTLTVKMLRAELLSVKANLERELERVVVRLLSAAGPCTTSEV